MQAVERQEVVTRPLPEFRVFVWTMLFRIYAERIVRLAEALKDLENDVLRWNEEQLQRGAQGLHRLLNEAQEGCKALGLTSARKQAERMKQRIPSGAYPVEDFSRDVEQLRIRLTEDMEECIFLCESDPLVISRFFIKGDARTDEKHWRFRSPEELFGSAVLEKFPTTAQDIESACRCYVAEEYMACVFHAMRVVEVGLHRIAELAQIPDTRPSWGAVLEPLERYAYRTDYKDLPEHIKLHREFIRSIIPHMQAVQRAWRNKVDHATLVPTQAFGRPDADAILGATRSLMLALAEGVK